MIASADLLDARFQLFTLEEGNEDGLVECVALQKRWIGMDLIKFLEKTNHSCDACLTVDGSSSGASSSD